METEQLLTVADVADRLKVTKGTVYTWVHRKLIPFQKINGRAVRFRWSEIDAWLITQPRNLAEAHDMGVQNGKDSDGQA